MLTLQLNIFEVDLFVFAFRDGSPKRYGLLWIFEDLGFVLRKPHGRPRRMDLRMAGACFAFCSSCTDLFVNNITKLHMLVRSELLLCCISFRSQALGL